jgi:hypothetical protein
VTDKELFDECIRVQDTPDGVWILVRKIMWDGPHTPISTWVVGQSMPLDAPEDDVHSAAEGLLQDPRFFGRCAECHERNPMGWMLSENLCQGCAERHGVVF